MNDQRDSEELDTTPIFESSDPYEIAMVEQLLSDNEIPFYKAGEAVSNLFGMGTLGGAGNLATGETRFRIRQRDFERARDLLSDFVSDDTSGVESEDLSQTETNADTEPFAAPRSPHPAAAAKPSSQSVRKALTPTKIGAIVIVNVLWFFGAGSLVSLILSLIHYGKSPLLRFNTYLAAAILIFTFELYRNGLFGWVWSLLEKVVFGVNVIAH